MHRYLCVFTFLFPLFLTRGRKGRFASPPTIRMAPRCRSHSTEYQVSSSCRISREIALRVNCADWEPVCWNDEKTAQGAIVGRGRNGYVPDCVVRQPKMVAEHVVAYWLIETITRPSWLGSLVQWQMQVGALQALDGGTATVGGNGRDYHVEFMTHCMTRGNGARCKELLECSLA